MLYPDDNVIVEEEIYINKNGTNVGILPVGLRGTVLSLTLNQFFGMLVIIEFENYIRIETFVNNRKIRKTGGQLTGEKNIRDNVWLIG